jgi:hypothetical protein
MYKNRFFDESSYKGSGSSSIPSRLGWERNMIGTTRSKELSTLESHQYARPVYGFIGTSGKKNALKQYANQENGVRFAFNLKKNRVEDRITFTNYNSSRIYSKGKCIPIKLPNIHKAGMTLHETVPKLDGKGIENRDYNEIQIWGGFDRFDVESIQVYMAYVKPEDFEKKKHAHILQYDLVEKLRKAGLIVNIRKEVDSIGNSKKY